jgi:hypothetical protein
VSANKVYDPSFLGERTETGGVHVGISSEWLLP